MAADGIVNDWVGINPALVDPVNDNLIRDFQRGGDMRSAYLCRDDSMLYLRIDTVNAVSENAEFIIKMRFFGDAKLGRSGGTKIIRVRPPTHVDPPEYHSTVAGNRLEVAIPLRDIGYCKELALNIESTIAGIQIDRTGYRFVEIP